MAACILTGGRCFEGENVKDRYVQLRHKSCVDNSDIYSKKTLRLVWNIYSILNII